MNTLLNDLVLKIALYKKSIQDIEKEKNAMYNFKIKILYCIVAPLFFVPFIPFLIVPFFPVWAPFKIFSIEVIFIFIFNQLTFPLVKKLLEHKNYNGKYFSSKLTRLIHNNALLSQMLEITLKDLAHQSELLLVLEDMEKNRQCPQGFTLKMTELFATCHQHDIQVILNALLTGLKLHIDNIDLSQKNDLMSEYLQKLKAHRDTMEHQKYNTHYKEIL